VLAKDTHLSGVIAGLDPAARQAMLNQQARQGVARPHHRFGGASGWMAGSGPAMTMENKAIPSEGQLF